MAISGTLTPRRPLWHYWIALLGAAMALGATLAISYAVNGAGRALPGFLGTNARFLSDLNLVMQVVMSASLLVGVALVRVGNTRAHQYTMTIVVLTNLVLIAFVMGTTFFAQVVPDPSPVTQPQRLSPMLHGIVGSVAELLGIYLILRMNDLIPEGWRVQNFKLLMRVTLILWLLTVAGGVVMYVSSYAVAPGAPAPAPSDARPAAGAGAYGYGQPSSTYGPAVGGSGAQPAVTVAPVTAAAAQAAPAQPPAPPTLTVPTANFTYTPKEITVKVGTVVIFANQDRAPHTATADGGQFDTGTVAAGATGQPITFGQTGTFRFFCRFHGGSGGQGMSGTIVVQP
jgi:plastocyanin/uncharacterized membrane protein YozB (DUF420 family)